jgi:hypothetical protein
LVPDAVESKSRSISATTAGISLQESVNERA